MNHSGSVLENSGERQALSVSLESGILLLEIRHAFLREQFHGTKHRQLGHVVKVHSKNQMIHAQRLDAGFQTLDAGASGDPTINRSFIKPSKVTSASPVVVVVCPQVM